MDILLLLQMFILQCCHHSSCGALYKV